MNPEQLHTFKLLIRRLWVLKPERLWLLSIGLQQRGMWRLAFAVKQVNSLLYNNSLAPGASVSPDIYLGHNSLGIVVTANVEIGRKVIIWQSVTLTAGRAPLPVDPAEMAVRNGAPGPAGEHAAAAPGKIIIEDNVRIGANSVVIAPRGSDLRIGRGARVGAGTVVTGDVPARATIVGPPARLLVSEAGDAPAPKPAPADDAEGTS
jgi:serine O-acetyltransferase